MAGKIADTLSALILVSAIMSTSNNMVSGDKVIMFPVQLPNHLYEAGAVAEGLINMGHEVWMVLNENVKTVRQIKITGLKYLFFKSPDKEMTDFEHFDKTSFELYLKYRGDSFLLRMQENMIQPRVRYNCMQMLYDKHLTDRIGNMSFDLAIVDALQLCSYLIPVKYKIPYVSMTDMFFTWTFRMHPVVSFQPCYFDEDTNTVATRVKQFIRADTHENILWDIIHTEEVRYSFYIPKRRFISLFDLMQKSKLWILNINQYLDCPRPSIPHVIYAGGLTTKPARPLSRELREFADGAEHGLVVVSFGSVLSNMPYRIRIKFIKAFTMIRQRVVWRLDIAADEPLELPENVKTVKWLPQNDLLGHNNTKVFINHCGNNGQSEALYHGVPMIGFPIFGDQQYNADRMVMKEFGLKMDMKEFQPEDLAHTIREIIDNPTYEHAIDRMSKIFRSEPVQPRAKAAYWIDHVMKYGGDHLQTSIHDLTLSQFFMLDILALMVAAVLVVALMILEAASFVKRKYISEPPEPDFEEIQKRRMSRRLSQIEENKKRW
ncbi:UDP-glucuronosyltransferase 2B20-like [Tubulanus polymorphus]|uniref:UDP-glucuronosyltransferase 2B20-like n=1 Tax=Tubulanus polymorphus TaxID=672921 RepID=UPI003DA3771F